MFDQRFNGGKVHLAQAAAAPQNIVVNVANSAVAGGGGDISSQLKSLHDLRTSGALTDEEFATEKRRLLTGTR